MSSDRTTTTSSTNGLGAAAGVAGVAGVACVACCAGPIIGVVAALGVGAAIAGAALFGIAGVALALVVAPFVRRRRAAAVGCTPATAEPEPVRLEPTRRS